MDGSKLSLSWLVAFKVMVLGDGNFGPSSEGSRDIINGKRVEEMGKLKEDVIKTNVRGVQGEKPKGVGLRRWTRGK